MELLASPLKFARVLGLTMFLALLFSKDCCSREIQVTPNFGEVSVMSCVNTQRTVAWFKNGKEMSGTLKTVIKSGTLYIFCLESSDNGEYVCKDKITATDIVSYSLTVNNPENRAYFHIFNQAHQKCLSRSKTELYVELCNLDHCKQKWIWTLSQQIMSAYDHKNPECISAHKLVNKNNVSMDSCHSNTSFQTWECKDGDLLSIQGKKLYLNYGNAKSDLIIYSGSGSWSRWVKFNSTHVNLCEEERKVILSQTRLVLSRGATGKVYCTGVDFINPSYKWLKNGKHIQTSSHAVHIDSDVLFVAFAYPISAGNYTCVVSDAKGTLKAMVTIDVFADPTIIQYSLNRTVNIGKDVCFSCQMYTTRTRIIKWYKDGSPILGENPRFNINKTRKGKYNKLWTHLCVKSVVLSDKGKYACAIRYYNKSLSVKEGELQVYGKPKVYIEKLEGGLLMCNVSGYPLPQLIWYKDGNHITENKNKERSLTVNENGGNYTCFASNFAGSDSRSIHSYVPRALNVEEKTSVGMIIGIIIGIVLIVVLVILIFCYCRRNKKTLNNNSTVYDTVRYTTTPGERLVERPSRIEFQPRCSTDPGPKHVSLKERVYHSMKPRTKTDWEIPHDCIKLDQKLGEGQFGQVWKGHVLSRKASRTVAIKMLRENSPNKDRKAIIEELEFMKTMSPHPNIIGLVGCCTRTENVMIVVEYVAHGNLKEYLLRSRGQERDTYANLAPYSTCSTSKDLISFAYQIARGMSYLEKIKCVHRDLAARNILVGDENTCKIADFGLARDIYCENYYRKTNGGRLPLRWMAYESIFNGLTTSQSDVWSFGVLLWEIVTLGGNPYPDMNRDQIIEALQRGYRMPKPHHCSDEVYAIMWECWQQNPDKRPTFSELTASFLRLISLQQIFIDMENFGDKDYVNVGTYDVEEEN